jgi:hypothetical protein
MTKKELRLKIKEELKKLAADIRIGKSLRKPRHYDKAKPEHKALAGWKCENNRWDFRHMHIMYCHMFNGTPYDDIEQPRENNRPDPTRLSAIQKRWEAEIDDEPEETLRTGT